MTVPAVDVAADGPRAVIVRLEARVAELEAELAAMEQLNFELKNAAESSRNFKATHAAGYIDLNLDNWGTSEPHPHPGA